MILPLLLALNLERCAPHTAWITLLSSKYSEQLRGTGFIDGTQRMELWVSEGKTWTQLVVFPNGIACAIGAGSDYEEYPMGVPG